MAKQYTKEQEEFFKMLVDFVIDCKEQGFTEEQRSFIGKRVGDIMPKMVDVL